MSDEDLIAQLRHLAGPEERPITTRDVIKALAFRDKHLSSCLCAECWAQKEDDWNARDAGWFIRPEVAGPPTLQVVSRRSPELQLPSESARRAGKIGPRPRCRVCGCTDDDCRQCIAVTGRPCHWVAPDLCSACVLPAEPSTPPAAIGDQAKFRFRRVGTRRPGQRKRGRRTAAAAAAGGGYV